MTAGTTHPTANFMLWLLVFAVMTACAALIGITYAPGDWYEALLRPSWTPPNDVFPKVWTVLYVLIAIAGCLVWTARKASLASVFWFGQLIANAAWSKLFFGMQRIDLGLLDIGILLVLIAGFIWSAWRVSKLASLLFVPYLVWVGIATALNAHIWVLNDMPMGVFGIHGLQ